MALPEIEAIPVEPVVAATQAAARDWARTPLAKRAECFHAAKAELTEKKEDLARGISLETGKPITEARGELGAVIAKFDLTLEDAQIHLAQREVSGGPHPARVRQAARGPAAIIAPFNFPLHLGNGALLAHLAAGNPGIFKPSPLAGAVAGQYTEIMARHFPPGVVGLVQGGADEAKALALDPRVRAVCFTGSVPAGRALAQALAGDFSKELALELGGRNAAIVCSDADLDLAARAIADAMGLTCGQRCNATSRILVDASVAESLLPRVVSALEVYRPGDPLSDTTKLGPLINEAAVTRYAGVLATPGDWVLPGGVVGEADGKRGHYVLPAIRRVAAAEADTECFVPVADFEVFSDLDDAIRRNNACPFGLTASVFTRSESTFWALADELHAGNIYANLPTTFSPSTLPFGGWGLSGNGRPGGRGFIRYCTEEQAVQFAAW